MEVEKTDEDEALQNHKKKSKEITLKKQENECAIGNMTVPKSKTEVTKFLGIRHIFPNP